MSSLLTYAAWWPQISADNLELDEQLAARDGEQQGVRRVISALHAHTWPGLQMKTEQRQAGKPCPKVLLVVLRF